MSFPYKNPISPSQLTGQQSLERTKTYGTNYSILSTGGYMEVFSLSDLLYTIPPSTFGPIEFSGNSIPITFSKGSGTTFSYDTLTLHPDNISSGRRKLGMMVYVYEENQLYQFIINNYETLWNNATGSTGTTIISDFGTTIKADSPENITFINSWTANTIDGVSGETYSTAVWKKLPTSGGGSGDNVTGGTFDKNTETLTLTNSTGGTISISGFSDVFVTGGTYSNGDITFTNNTGGTFNVSGLFTGNTDVFVTGSTYNNNTFTFTNNTGGTFDVSFNTVTGLTINGDLNVTGVTTSETISATTYQNLPTDVFVTGGTYSAGTTTFTNNTGGTFDVVGFFTGETDNFITGGTFDKNTETLTLNYVTGGTISISGFSDVFVTGGTYSAGTATFTNNTGGTFDVSGFFTGNTDVFVTGSTYNNNTFTFTNNTGGTFDVSFNIVTGLTINGNLNISGDTEQVGDFNITGNTTQIGNNILTGNLNVTGLTNLNGLTTVYGNTPISAAIQPGLNNTYDLGNPSLRWREIYTTNIDVSNLASINYLIVNITSEFYNTANFYNGGVNITGDTNQVGNLNITGNTIIQSGITASSYNISTIPTQNDSLTQILGRNTTTGEIEYRNINTIGNNYTYVSGATYSALTTDNVIGVDSSISATTIYLPDSVSSGRLRYDIKDIGLNSFNNNITIISTGSDTIISTENSNNVVLESDGGALIFFNTATGIWLQM